MDTLLHNTGRWVFVWLLLVSMGMLIVPVASAQTTRPTTSAPTTRPAGQNGERPATRRKAAPVQRPSVRLKPVLVKRAKHWWHNSYLLDWGISLALAGGGVGLNFVNPPERPFRTDDPLISLPFHEDTISEPLVAALAMGIPLATFALAQIGLRSGHDFHHAALGLAEAFSLTFFFTMMLKVTVGRLRPDFLERCQASTDLLCTGDPREVIRGRRSFPSGHASFAMTGGVYLSLYLWAKLRPFQGPGSFWKIPVILAPIAGATLVAASRIVDNRHHWEDVLVGSLLGAGFAILGYHLNFPAPWSDNANKPYTRNRVAIIPLVTPTQVGMAFSGKF